MYEEITNAKKAIHDSRQKVNSTWENWLPLVRHDDLSRSAIDEMFDDASDKIADDYEKLLDLLGNTEEASRREVAKAIVTDAGSAAATVLQRVVSWHLTDVRTLIYKWQFRWFFVIEDVSQDLRRLDLAFKQATDAHEQNQFADAISKYFAIADDAIELRSKVRQRPRMHPQRRQIILTIVALVLGSLALAVGLANLWLRVAHK